jgi:hypothetical protein
VALDAVVAELASSHFEVSDDSPRDGHLYTIANLTERIAQMLANAAVWQNVLAVPSSSSSTQTTNGLSPEELFNLSELAAFRGPLCGRISEDREGHFIVVATCDLPLVNGRIMNEFKVHKRSIRSRLKPLLRHGKKVKFTIQNLPVKGFPTENGKPSEVLIDRILEDVEEAEITRDVQARRNEPFARELRRALDETRALRTELEASEAEIKQQIAALDQQRKHLAQASSDLDARKDLLCADEAALAGWKSLLGDLYPGSSKEDGRQGSFHPLGSSDLGSFKTHLNSIGYQGEPQLVSRFFVSLLASAIAGRFLLMNGPVGTGKTRLLRAAAAFFGQIEDDCVFPVRPAWLDPTDLFGYFDPFKERFHPTALTRALREHRKADGLRFVCLDEMNLARIENYAADLLSCLEYGGGGERFVQIQGADPREALERLAPFAESRQRNACEEIDDEASRWIAALENAVPVPSNVVFAGTLNSDESTFQLTPKMVDRSFVVQFVPLNLSEVRLGRTKHGKTSDFGSTLDIAALRESVVDWYPKAAEVMGTLIARGLIPPPRTHVAMGHRVVQDLAAILMIATAVGIETEEALDCFLLTKVLPRVYLPFKASAESEKALPQLRKFLKLIETRGGLCSEVGTGLLDQIDSDLVSAVSYWHLG